MAPGPYTVQLLWECMHVLYNYDLYVQLRNTINLWSFYPDDEEKSGIHNDITSSQKYQRDYTLSVWTEVPLLASVLPLGGSISGGTKMTISGSFLKGIIACKFSQGTKHYTTRVISSGENTCVCIAPQVNIIGQYSLAVSYKGETWISTKYSFTFYLNPVFFNGVNIPLKGLLNQTDVYGSLFPHGSVYCKVVYADSYVLLLGSGISSKQIRCLKVVILSYFVLPHSATLLSDPNKIFILVISFYYCVSKSNNKSILYASKSAVIRFDVEAIARLM